jgi:hypothetical protein
MTLKKTIVRSLCGATLLSATMIGAPLLILCTGQPRALSTSAARFVGTRILPTALGVRVDCDRFDGRLTDFTVSNLRLAYTGDGVFRVPRKFDGTVSLQHLRVQIAPSDAAALFRSPIVFIKQVLAFDREEKEEAGAVVEQRVLHVDLFECRGVDADIRFREPSPTPPPNVLIKLLQVSDVRARVVDWTRHDAASIDRQIPLPGIRLEHASMRDVSSRKPLGALLFRSSLLMHVGATGVIAVNRSDDQQHIAVNVSNVPFGFVRSYARPPLTLLDEANVSVSVRLERLARDWDASGHLKLDSIKLLTKVVEDDNTAMAGARAYFNSLSLGERIPPIPFDVSLSGAVDDETNAENFVKRLAVAVATEIGVRASVTAIKSGVQFFRNQLESIRSASK